METYVVGTHKKHLARVLLIGLHNFCFHAEIKKYYKDTISYLKLWVQQSILD